MAAVDLVLSKSGVNQDTSNDADKPTVPQTKVMFFLKKILFLLK